MRRIYEGIVTDAERRRLLDARSRVRTLADGRDAISRLRADPELLAELLASAGEVCDLSEKAEQEVLDLDVLYTMTVEHAATVEHELYLKNQEISAFLASMSHELRTPLTAIIGYSELLAEELSSSDSDDLAQDAERITRSGRYLLALLNDVLDLSKVEAGRMQFCWESVDVGSLVADIELTVQPLAKRNENHFVTLVGEDVGQWVVDSTRLRQCLLNLLGNAFKFTSRGVVRLEAAVDRDVLEIVVSDTGLGMSPEQLATIFDPYVQAQASTFRDFGGTGLGLSLTQRLCTAMGGEVTASSEEGRGSVFTLRLPRREEAIETL